MDVVSPELNSLLPDEIMDTEAIEVVPHSQPVSAMVQSEASVDTPVPMETDTPAENLKVCPDATSVKLAQTLSTSISTPTPTDSALGISSESHVLISGSPSSLLTLKPALSISTATTKTTDSVTATTVSTSGLQKLQAPFTISPANHQIILNKVASSQATEATKPAETLQQVIKQDGQKLLVTTIGKPGQPIVLQLPHMTSKPGASQTSGDLKSPVPHFKVLTIGGRSELKPVVGSPANQLTTVQAQQLKAVQVKTVKKQI